MVMSIGSQTDNHSHKIQWKSICLYSITLYFSSEVGTGTGFTNERNGLYLIE
jgi:hypothetical protein